LIGIDVLIDANGRPMLLEVNSSPSLAISEANPNPNPNPNPNSNPNSNSSPSLAISEAVNNEGDVTPRAQRELSPVDCYVKRKVLSDTLDLISATINNPDACGAACRVANSGLRLLTSGRTSKPTLVTRLRRVFEASGASPSLSTRADGSMCSTPCGLTSSQFLRFVQQAFPPRSGPPSWVSLTSKPGLVILHQQHCSLQDRSDRARRSPFCGAEPVPKMRFDAFVRSMSELATAGFPDREDRGDRMEELLRLIIDHGAT